MKGDWQTGLPYRFGDVTSHGGGSYAATINHESAADFQDELDAGYWQVLAAPGEDTGGGGGGTVLDRQRFEALGTVNGGSRVIGQYILTQACSLQAAHPIAAALGSGITAGGDPFDIVKKAQSVDRPGHARDTHFLRRRLGHGRACRCRVRAV